MRLKTFSHADYLVTKNWSCAECKVDCGCLSLDAQVEILVSSFQHEESIQRAIESILRQDFPFDRLVVTLHDDGSTDSTVKTAIRSLGKSGIKFTILGRTKNLFQVERFRFFYNCVKNSRAKFLAFLDGDDEWIDEEKLSRQIEALESDDTVAIVHTEYLVVNKLTSSKSLQPDPTLSEPKKCSVAHLRRENFIGTLTCVVRVASISWDVSIDALSALPVGDYPIWILATRHESSKLLFLPRITAAYHIHGNNYWASGSMLSQLHKTRLLQKEIGSLFSLPIGEPILIHVMSVLLRRWNPLRLGH